MSHKLTPGPSSGLGCFFYCYPKNIPLACTWPLTLFNKLNNLSPPRSPPWPCAPQCSDIQLTHSLLQAQYNVKKFKLKYSDFFLF